MSTLHTVNKSPFTHTTLCSCLEICSESDAILLLEDGVFGAIAGSPTNDKILELICRGLKVYALIDDINARGLQEKTNDHIITVNYDGFVQLSIEHRCVQSWY